MARVQPAMATVSKDGRIRLPAAVLQALGLREGGQLVFLLKSGQTTALVAPVGQAIRDDLSW